MMDDDNQMMDDQTEDAPSGQGKMAGDGMHHHEIHEDEGGGYHSMHTDPDGHVQHDDHVTYDDAKNKMDQDFGHGEPDGDEGDGGDNGGGDMDMSDIAGSYGRHAASSD